MSILLLLKGILLGFSIAAPVGPIGVLCIRRTLAHGRASGFLSGLGAATADGIYAGIAGFGLTAITGFLSVFNGYFKQSAASFSVSSAYRHFSQGRQRNRRRPKPEVLSGHTPLRCC